MKLTHETMGTNLHCLKSAHSSSTTEVILMPVQDDRYSTALVL